MCASELDVGDVRARSGVRRVAGDSAGGSAGDARALRRRQRRRVLYGVYRCLS